MSVNYNDEKAAEYADIYEQMEDGERPSGRGKAGAAGDDDGPSYEELRERYETEMLNEDSSKDQRDKKQKERLQRLQKIEETAQLSIENVYVMVDWKNQRIVEALIGEDRNRVITEAKEIKSQHDSDVRIIQVPVKKT